MPGWVTICSWSENTALTPTIPTPSADSGMASPQSLIAEDDGDAAGCPLAMDDEAFVHPAVQPPRATPACAGAPETPPECRAEMRLHFGHETVLRPGGIYLRLQILYLRTSCICK